MLKVFALVVLLSSQSIFAVQGDSITSGEKAAAERFEKAARARDAAITAFGKDVGAWKEALAAMAAKTIVAAGATVKEGEAGLKGYVNGIRAAVARQASFTDDQVAAVTAEANQRNARNLEEAKKLREVANQVEAEAERKLLAAQAASAETDRAVTETLVASVTGAGRAVAASGMQKTLEMHVKRIGLEGDFREQARIYRDLNDAVVLLERNLDRSTMAVYIQQKMARLLSSDSLCKAAKSCDASGKNTTTFKATDIGEIFPQSGQGSKPKTAPTPAATK